MVQRCKFSIELKNFPPDLSGEPDSALRVLNDVKNDSRALFPMAIAYHIKGDWRKAEELLKEAYKQGDDRARAFYGENAYE